MRRETPETISAWSIETFTSKGTRASVCARAMLEFAELNFALVCPDGVRQEDIRAECADVYIVLSRVATRDGVHAVIDRWVEDEHFWFKDRCDVGELIRTAAAFLLRLQDNGDSKLCLTAVLARMKRVCEIYGGDFWLEIDKKMAINRGRTWQLDGNGHGQHVA